MNEPKITCPNCKAEIPQPVAPGVILCTACGTKVNFIVDTMQHFRNLLSGAIQQANGLGIHIDLQIVTVDLLHDELLVMRRMALNKAAKNPLIVRANGNQLPPGGRG